MTEKTLFLELWHHANLYIDKAYCPYSNFPVVCALKTESGKIVGSCNIENASYSLCLCAETNAIMKAISEKKELITDLLVYAPKLDYCPPCGACRQRIAEFSDDNTVIYMCKSNQDYKTVKMKDLLPGQFSLQQDSTTT